jgi:hypothetical protein
MKKITRLFLLIAALAGMGNVAFGQNTECSGTSTDPSTPSQGTFTLGYNYTFTTVGTDVTVTFELLDTQVGLVAYAWTYNPGFAETMMTQGTGQTFSKTFTGQTPGATFSVACKFAYAGGMAVTKTLTYTVGNTCVVGPPDTEIPTAFTATKGAVTSSSVELLLNGTDNSGAVKYSITFGTTTLNTSSTSGVQKSYVVTGLSPLTDYSFSVSAMDASNNQASNNPIVIAATTTAVPGPQTAAPTPPAYSAPKVISIFSDAYTPISGTINLNPGWGQATQMSTIQVDGNNVIKYANLNYQGTDFGSDVNVVPMAFLHVDVWSADETSLQFFLINHAPQSEKFVALTPINLNAWNSYDIPLSAFTSQGLILTNIYQFKVVGSGGKTVYLDNMYFYDPSADVDTEAPTAFTATAGAITYNSVELLLNATDNSGAVNYVIKYGTTTLNTGGLSGVQKSYVINGLDQSTDYSFSVEAKDATGNTAANNPIVVTASTPFGFAIPTVAAPTPTTDPLKVISIFSDAYTNLAANFAPGWGQSTIYSEVSIAGNATKKYENFGYQGIELSAPVDASAMNKLHVDIWTPNETVVRITPISPGKELPTALVPLTQNVWNSYDIELSAFTGVVYSNLIQFKLDGGTGKIFYMDNLYLYNDLGTSLSDVTASYGITCYPNPTVDNFTVSAKSEISQVSVRNLMGQSVKSVTVNSLNKTIDLTGVSAGNYFITVKLATGSVSTYKIVKL